MDEAIHSFENIATQFGAKGLNGAAPQYLVRRNSSSNKWVLFLEGGGWCYGSTSAATIASCAERGGFNPQAVSAMDYGFTMDYGGILVQTPQQIQIFTLGMPCLYIIVMVHRSVVIVYNQL